jgi:nicotinate-nucleotide adenylyltransferase
MTPKRRLGILGGTFDPPHIGHLVTAVNVRYELALDEVLLVVANEPWQKIGDRPVTSVQHRLAMVHAAAEGFDGVEVDDREVRRGGPSYTADTLEELAGPDRELFVILGSDAAAGLHTWHRVEVVEKLATVAVVHRPGRTVPAGGSGTSGVRIEHVDVPALDVSSTDIRRRVADGRPIDVLVPPAVAAYVQGHRLYGVSR